ncbi:MAG: hypothetical protein CL666_12640 [Balneola sp.]|nr:hypothetical protein [Balneola sp.]
MRKNHLWYQMFRFPIVKTGLNFFYRRIRITGREKIPKNKPILFVPNHQNSFMDALHVVTTVRPFIYFLTRAEAFNPKPLDWFLRSLNMLPVYRVRDGFSSVQKNNAIFEECIRYMHRNDAIMIFAEANHNLKKRIRPLSKGFTRVAFGGEEASDWELDIQIVPVGINYTAHREAQNTVHVVYGDPIPVNHYKSEFKEDENAAAQTMKADVSEAMKKLVFHVEDLEEYPVQEILWNDLEPEEAILTDPNVVNPRIQKASEYITPKLTEQAKEAKKLADKHDIPLRDFAISDGLSFREFLLFPVYMFSYFNNLIPYQPVKYLTTKVIKDHAFDASIKFLTGLFILPIFYTLISLILYFTGVDSSWIWGYAILSVLSAPLFTRGKTLFAGDKIRQLQRSHPEEFNKILKILDSFQALRDKILTE